MKKLTIKFLSIFITALLITSLLGALVSCNQNDIDDTSTESDTNTDESTTDEITTNSDMTTPRNPLSAEEIESLFSEVKSEIQSAYFEKTYEEKSKESYNSPEQVSVTCYGVFNDAYCVILTYPLVEYLTEETEVKVGQYTFVFGDSNTMAIYCNGEFYSLTKAYENGILDDTEIAELYTYYDQVKWGR